MYFSIYKLDTFWLLTSRCSRALRSTCVKKDTKKATLNIKLKNNINDLCLIVNMKFIMISYAKVLLVHVYIYILLIYTHDMIIMIILCIEAILLYSMNEWLIAGEHS